MSPACSLEDRGKTTAIEPDARYSNSQLLELALHSVETGRYADAARAASEVSFSDEPDFDQKKSLLDRAKAELRAGDYHKARETLFLLSTTIGN